MYNRVLEYVAKSNAEDAVLPTGRISKSFLNQMVQTDINDVNDVINNNDELTEAYKHIVSAYGFDDFYGLYSYADSCESYDRVAKGGKKDLSKLNKVTRKVRRNGKMVDMTIYESNGDDSNDEIKDTKKKGGGGGNNAEPQVASNAKELVIETIGKDGMANPKEIMSAQKEFKGLKGEGKDFDSTCESFMILRDEEGNVKAIAGYKVEGKYMYLAFYKGDGLVNGVALRAFFELIKRARQANLGAMVDATDNKLALELFASYGLKKSGDTYKVSKNTLEKLVGDF